MQSIPPEVQPIMANGGQQRVGHWSQRTVPALALSLATLLASCGGGAPGNTSTPPAPAPTVSSISPSSGPRAGGTPVTVAGSGFLSGATVSVGGSVCASPVVSSGTQISCTTGPGPAGQADVVVSNPGGLSGALRSGFSYVLVLFVDGNGPNGLNRDVSEDAATPTAAALAGKLYVAWVESDVATSVSHIRVSVYHGDDSAPAWSPVEGGAALGINKDAGQPAAHPRLVVFHEKLYATWVERSAATTAFQVRVASYDGNDDAPVWSFVDLNGTNGINKNAAKDAQAPRLAIFNGKLYASWSEADNGDFHEIRAAVYNGMDSAPSWTFVDGNNPTIGLNKNPARDADEPSLVAFNAKLYVAWEEVGTEHVRIRVAAYRGDDSAPAWDFVDGDGADGLAKDPAASAGGATLVVHGSSLYASWWEDLDLRSIQLRVAVNDGTDTWKFVDGNGTNGINHDPNQFAGPAALMVLGNSLYCAWQEGLGFPPFPDQIRLATYNGNDSSPAWPFADANGTVGLNKNPLKNADAVQLAVLNSKLYLVWQEENADSKFQIRVAVLQ